MGIPHRLFLVFSTGCSLPKAFFQSIGILTYTPKKRNFAMNSEPLT